MSCAREVERTGAMRYEGCSGRTLENMHEGASVNNFFLLTSTLEGSVSSPNGPAADAGCVKKVEEGRLYLVVDLFGQYPPKQQVCQPDYGGTNLSIKQFHRFPQTSLRYFTNQHADNTFNFLLQWYVL